MIQTIDLEVPRPGDTNLHIFLEAPGTLAAPGEIAVLLLAIAPDVESLGAAGVQPADLLPGARYLEISILISADNGATFDEIDPARVDETPLSLLIDHLSSEVNHPPLLYEHPSYIASNPSTGIAPVAEAGAWTLAPSYSGPYAVPASGDTTQRVYLSAQLSSLSLFAPSPGPEVIPEDEPETPIDEPLDEDGSTGEIPVVIDPGDTISTDATSDTTTLTGDTETLTTGEEDGGGEMSLLLSPGEPVWVDFGQNGPEDGTQYNPFDTFIEGLYAAVINGSDTINVDRLTPIDRSGETGVYAPPGPVIVQAVNGPVRIGQAGHVLYTYFTQWGAVTYDPVGSTTDGDLPYAINPEFRVFNDGDIVTVNAYPATGLRFRGWWSPDTDFDEDVVETDLMPSTQHRIIMNRDRFVWALFEPNTENYDLTDSDADGFAVFRETALGTSDTDSDSDDDGLPDGWESNYGLDPLSSSGDHGPTGDPDADSVNNLDEYLAGRSPLFDDDVPPPAVPSPPFEILPVEPDDLNPDFNFTDFSSIDGLSTWFNAVASNSEIALIPAGGYKKGVVWTTNQLPVAKGFSTTFEFDLRDFLSDGISFVIQNSAAITPLTDGGRMGYTGIPNSIAIELDMHNNPEMNDFSASHLSIHTRGANTANDANETYSIASASPCCNLTVFHHRMTVSYDPATMILSAAIDNNPALSTTIDLETALNLSDGKAYIGIMATSGDPLYTNGPTTLYSWSADFITSPAAADLRLVRVTAERTDNGATINELDNKIPISFEDFDSGFVEWGQPDAYPDELEEQQNLNLVRGEYPRSFDVYFDQVARPVPDDELSAPFNVTLQAFVEGGFPDTTYNMVWSFDQGSTVAGAILNFGQSAVLEFTGLNPPEPGLYKIKCEARLPGEQLAPPNRTAVAYVLLPYAGPEISDWLIEEARQIANPGGVGDQWVSLVDSQAVFWDTIIPVTGPIVGQVLDFRNRAFATISSGFDYTNHMTFNGTPPTKRFNFDDSQRASSDPLINAKPHDDPSFATLQGLVVSRAKITDLLWALWGRSVDRSEFVLNNGAGAFNWIERYRPEAVSSKNAYQLGFDLFKAVRDGASAETIRETVLIRSKVRGIQSDGGLNDIRLWPRPFENAPPHIAPWGYVPQTYLNLNLSDGLTWGRPIVFKSGAEMDLNPLTN